VSEAIRRKGAYSTRPHTQGAHTPLRSRPKARKETIILGETAMPTAEAVAHTRAALAGIMQAQADRKERKRALKAAANKRARAKRAKLDAAEARIIVNVLLPDWRIPGKRYKMSDKLSVGLPADLKRAIRALAKAEQTSMTEVARRRLGPLFKRDA